MMLETPCHREVAICRCVLKNPNPRPKACAIFALSIQRIHMPYKVITLTCFKIKTAKLEKKQDFKTFRDFIDQTYCSCKQRDASTMN